MYEKCSDEEMRVNVERLLELQNSRGWNEVMLAKQLNLHYSYVYRVLRNQRNAGIKFIMELFKLCKKEGLDFNEFLSI